MPTIKVTDIAYVRCAVPDLGVQQEFHEHFGFVTTLGDDGRLYSRGTDASPYYYVSELGDPAFLALGFEAGSAEDLLSLAQLDEAGDVESLDAPGGGSVVRLTDPDGVVVEVVHGRELAEERAVVGAEPLNRGNERIRLGVLQRVPSGPAQVKRLGHVVLTATDFAVSRAWYQSTLGFVDSDEIFLKDEADVFMSFMRCDRGAVFTDHHTVALLGSGSSGLEHAAFEVQDFDAVMAGHDHLRSTEKYEHARGIGRHVLGAQVFDYWKDPSGQMVEHYADGDMLNDQTPSALEPVSSVMATQWGTMDPAT